MKTKFDLEQQITDTWSASDDLLAIIMGLDETTEDHQAWKTRKHELACILADSELISDPQLAEALKTRYLQE